MSDTPLSVLPLGVGDAFSARYYSTCLLVESQGYRLLVECPHPVRKMAAEAAAACGEPLDVASIDAVYVSHLHADHCCGLEDFAFYRRMVVAGSRPKLVLHRSLVEDLWRHHLAYGLAPLCAPPSQRRRMDDFFAVVPVDESAPVQVGPFALAVRRTGHKVPTFAVRLSAGSRSVAYSADTPFDPELIDWLSAADLVIHETNVGIHTPLEALCALPEAVRLRMRLVHYPDDLDPETAPVACLRQGARCAV